MVPGTRRELALAQQAFETNGMRNEDSLAVMAIVDATKWSDDLVAAESLEMSPRFHRSVTPLGQ